MDTPPVVLIDCNNLERWKWVRGYKGYYRVSTHGRVKSVDRKVRCRGGKIRISRGKVLSPGPIGSGYLGVNLAKKGVVKRRYVHRLVARAFLPNPKNLPEVNHKDTNKHNCRVSNLEWVTQLGNAKHAVKNNLVAYGIRVPNAKLNDRKARKIFRSIDLQRRTAARFGVSVMIVSLIKRRKIWRRATEDL